MDYAVLAAGLAGHIRNVVRPRLGLSASREIAGTACSGDATFSIDVLAEEAVVEYIQTHNLNVAYYTEDAGLRKFGEPEVTLIIDPIDGSRGAVAGFECCVVSVAVATYCENVTMGDVLAGCIYEIKDDRIFTAKKGRGVQILDCDRSIDVRVSKEQRLERAAWSAEIVGRPVRMIMETIGEAIDRSSVKGGFFIINSTAFSLTRLVTGQLSAVVDVGGRVLYDLPGAEEQFLRAGCGNVIGLFPYDFAAAALIAAEAGCKITDAYGKSLDTIPLLEASKDSVQTIVAACTPELHDQFMDVIERGIQAELTQI